MCGTQRVSDNIRESYSKFWLAILGQDVDGIAKYGRELGVGDLAGLFACMVTARSWDSITRGIDKHSINDAEVRLFDVIHQTLPARSLLASITASPVASANELKVLWWVTAFITYDFHYILTLFEV
jgi:hypothetical protein